MKQGPEMLYKGIKSHRIFERFALLSDVSIDKTVNNQLITITKNCDFKKNTHLSLFKDLF